MLSAVEAMLGGEHAAARGRAWSLNMTADDVIFAVYLTADDVIAATRDTMEATLDYLDQKYGSIDKYCQEVRSPAPLLRVLCTKVMRGCDVRGACVSQVLRHGAAHLEWCSCVKLLLPGGSWQGMTPAGSPCCCPCAQSAPAWGLLFLVTLSTVLSVTTIV